MQHHTLYHMEKCSTTYVNFNIAHVVCCLTRLRNGSLIMYWRSIRIAHYCILVGKLHVLCVLIQVAEDAPLAGIIITHCQSKQGLWCARPFLKSSCGQSCIPDMSNHLRCTLSACCAVAPEHIQWLCMAAAAAISNVARCAAIAAVQLEVAQRSHMTLQSTFLNHLPTGYKAQSHQCLFHTGSMFSACGEDLCARCTSRTACTATHSCCDDVDAMMLLRCVLQILPGHLARGAK